MNFEKKDKSKIVLFLLITAILVITGVIIYQTYIIHSLKEAIQQTREEKLNTKAGPLAVVKNSEAEIKSEIEEFKVKLNQTEVMLKEANEQKKILQQEKEEMSRQLEALKEESRLWSGEIKSLEEKSMVLERRAKGLKELQRRIKIFKRKAQQEMDRIKSELGNHGYITKQGKCTFNRKNIVELEKIIITHSSTK